MRKDVYVQYESIIFENKWYWTLRKDTGARVSRRFLKYHDIREYNSFKEFFLRIVLQLFIKDL